jgi:competence protein ComEA
MLKPIISTLILAVSSAAFAGEVNINTADIATLDTELAGVGPVVAQRIVDYRAQYGQFASAEDLTKVRGIGEITLDKNRDSIVLK